MKRSEWVFMYTAAQVAEAADAQHDYHTERMLYWRAERAKAEDDLREHGIEIVHHQVTGGSQSQALLDPEKAKWLQQCQSKMESHQAQAQKFAEWVNTLEAAVGKELGLHQDDVAYFWPVRAEEE